MAKLIATKLVKDNALLQCKVQFAAWQTFQGGCSKHIWMGRKTFDADVHTNTKQWIIWHWNHVVAVFNFPRWFSRMSGGLVNVISHWVQYCYIDNVSDEVIWYAVNNISILPYVICPVHNVLQIDIGNKYCVHISVCGCILMCSWRCYR